MANRIQSQKILIELENRTEAFTEFQKASKLACPPGCGKCCENPDIHCSPYELLPMAYQLLDAGLADQYLKLAFENKDKSCVFYENNKCSQYKFRPYVCRSFAVAARHKKDQIEFSICKILKEHYKVEKINANDFTLEDIPFIETSRTQFESIEPELQNQQMPLNLALLTILEKVLMKEAYSKLNE